jgi:C-terminal region of Mon2 protein
LSHQSTVPARSTSEEDVGHEQVSLDAAGVNGVIGGTVTAESYMTGISSIWSLPKTPCLEQLDKNDAPNLPETYIYSLVLNSMASMSEGLAKSVMPMNLAGGDKRAQVQASEQQKEWRDESIRSDETGSITPDLAADPPKFSRSVNAVSSTAHPQHESMRTAVAFVTSCWPAVLATCATFLNAALDAECYHSLVRAVQKFSQSAGVLELWTPRDAFLTTLAKAAVPAHVFQSAPNAHSRKIEVHSVAQSATDAGSAITNPAGESIGENHASTKADISPLTTRNLLCLRALLNLGIALGPTLSQEAWFILLETLQEAENLIRMSSRLLTNQSGKLAADKVSDEPSDGGDRLAGEIAAVRAASKKMFASTSNYDNDVFLGLLRALLSLSLSTQSAHIRKDVASPVESRAHGRVGRMHQSSRSASGPFFKAAVEDNQVLFVLTKTSEMARSNLGRFARESAADSGWSLITASLLHVIKSGNTVSEMRLRAASLLDSLVLGTLSTLDNEDEHLQREAQHRAVAALRHQIGGLYQQQTFSASESRNIDLDIHERAIETLISIVEQHGENLLISWEAIFGIGQSIFEDQQPPPEGDLQQDMRVTDLRARSVRLISTSFRLLQLIGSDFLNLLSLQSLLGFLETLLLFGRQHDDLNVSLTSSTFFWNLADFLQSEKNHPSLDALTDVPEEELLVRQVTCSEDATNASESFWLLLLLRLNILTTDSRAEVRNSAIRVMLKILDASGPSLSPHGWHICLSFIVLRVLKSHDSTLIRIRQDRSDAGSKRMHEWYASTVALLEGAINLICNFASTVCADKQFFVFLEQLFELLGSVLTNPSLAISLVAFQGVTLLFSALEKAGYHDASAADAALKLWIRCHPADISNHLEREEFSTEEKNSNQDAFTTHAEMIVRGSEAFPTLKLDQIAARDILQALRKTIFRCVHPPYGTDVLKMGPEQDHVIAILQLLSKTQTSKSTEYHKTLLDFIQIAFRDVGGLENETYLELPVKQDLSFRNGQKPTFVAFSAKCIDILEGDIIKKIQQDTVADNSVTLCSALDVHCDTIKAKYSARAHRGDPLLWRKATASAISIIEAVSRHISNIDDQDKRRACHHVYGSAVEIAAGILCSGRLEDMNRLPERNALLADEEHDIGAFKRLSLTLIPALTRLTDADVAAHPLKTSEIQRNFALSLFRASMIAAPQYADLPPDEDLVSSPISSLLQVRPGTIKEVVFRDRGRIPYLALDTLFKLTEAFDGDGRQLSDAFQGHVALAKPAGSYVLLRAAHTLKSFIADQPLRGPMPMPSKLRAEMRYVLRLCLHLRSEDAAFVGKSGSHACLGRDGKRHLRVLHPLILRMWHVWRRMPRYGPSWITDDDGVDIENCLHQWMAMCGANWELVSVGS